MMLEKVLKITVQIQDVARSLYIEAVSFRSIATVEQLQLECTHKHTRSQLYRIPHAATPDGYCNLFYIIITFPGS